MYAETGLMFPYFTQFDEFSCSHKPYFLLGMPSSLIQTSTISDYNLGAESDLFNAPEPVIAEPLTGLDPMTAAISMISCGEDAISPQSLTVSDIESSIESGQLLSEVFYECRKDLLAKEGSETPLCEALNIKINPNVQTDENFVIDKKLLGEHVAEAPLRPRFLDFPVLDFGSYNGMRRAFSEGDIKTLGNGDASLRQSYVEQPRIMSCCASDDRREKLSRYWNKKSKRNFGRKIKYACRKALADSQPRIRGRFARTEETCSKMQ